MNIVGKYKQVFNNLLHINLPCTNIYVSFGLKKHIEESHPICIKYLNELNSIICSPDYIGCNPKEDISIELIKKYDKNIQVAIKLDVKQEYLFIPSIYDFSDSKINKRLHSGGIVTFKNPILYLITFIIYLF